MANSVGSGQQEKRKKKKGKLDIVVCVWRGGDAHRKAYVVKATASGRQRPHVMVAKTGTLLRSGVFILCTMFPWRMK